MASKNFGKTENENFIILIAIACESVKNFYGANINKAYNGR